MGRIEVSLRWVRKLLDANLKVYPKQATIAGVARFLGINRYRAKKLLDDWKRRKRR